MKPKTIILFLGIAGLVLPVTLRGSPPPDDPVVKEIGRTTEKELKVELSSSVGSVVIERGDREKMIVIEADPKNRNGDQVTVDYEIRNRVGYADLSLGADEGSDGKSRSFRLKDLEGGNWYVRFSDAVPISFDMKLGFGKGDIDLSGLQVKDFNLSTGASEVSLAFDELNKSTIENVNIETGLSKFEGRNLGNANFKHFRFQGGVGAYRLDFSGHISNEVDVDIELGMGVMTLIVPPEVGAKVYHEKSWVSRVDCDRDFNPSSDNEYVSENYDSANGKMNIRIDSGVGSIRVRRR
jgi:hypothetical protein